MKYILLFFLLFSFAFNAYSQGGTTPDWANKAGAIGIGASPTLSSFSTNDENSNKWNTSNLGLVVVGRYGISQLITGQIGLGFSQQVSTIETKQWDSEVKTNGIVANIGVQGNIQPAFSNRVNLGIIVGVDIFNGTATSKSTGMPRQTEDVSQIIFELGIRPEYHLSNFFNIIPVETSFFIDLTVLSAGTSSFDGYKENTVQIFGVSETFGTAGFTFWFN